MPLSYSQGFHPQPKMAFSAALPLGQESHGEYLDLTLTQRVDASELLEQIRAELADGFCATAIQEIPVRHKRSLMSLNQGGAYVLTFPETERARLKERVAALNAAEEIFIERKGKTRRKGSKRRQRRERVVRSIDIRPMILHLEHDPADALQIRLTVVMSDGKPGKAREVVGLLTDDPSRVGVVKEDTLTWHDESWTSLFTACEGLMDSAVDSKAVHPIPSCETDRPHPLQAT